MDFLIFFTIFAQKMAQLPKEFIQNTRLVMGEERFNSYMEAFNSYMEAFNEEAPTSIRLNPKYNFGAMSQHAVPWCEEGFYLEGRPQFTFDPLFHAGCYYVQEAASMFVTHILRQSGDCPQSALDLCAAPGGSISAQPLVANLPPCVVCCHLIVCLSATNPWALVPRFCWRTLPNGVAPTTS